MGRHNRSEEAFFDFIPNENFSCLIRRWGGGSRAPSEPPLDPPLWIALGWNDVDLLSVASWTSAFLITESILSNERAGIQNTVILVQPSSVHQAEPVQADVFCCKIDVFFSPSSAVIMCKGNLVKSPLRIARNCCKLRGIISALIVVLNSVLHR